VIDSGEVGKTLSDARHGLVPHFLLRGAASRRFMRLADDARAS
jgi:hypothetical protein